MRQTADSPPLVKPMRETANNPPLVKPMRETANNPPLVKPMRETATSPLQKAAVEDELHAVWVHQRGCVSERLRTLDRALVAIEQGGLDPARRCDAERVAHMLAGSLGTFGFTRASQAAMQLELELMRPRPERVPALAELLREVREDLQRDPRSALAF
jgi:hypothetical protein